MSLPNNGFIRLSRKFFDHPFWKEDRTRSLAEAWLDLIASARFEVAPEKVIVKMKTITIHRGELRASQRYLSERWKWSVGKVNRYLNLLEDQKMIERRFEHSETILKISNYESYNAVSEQEGEQPQTGSVKGGKTPTEHNREHQREHLRPLETLTKPGIQEPPDAQDEHKMNGNGYANGTPTEHQWIQTKESKEYINNPPTPLPGGKPSIRENSIDYQKLVSLYHQKCPEMPAVKTLNTSRKRAVNARVKEHGKFVVAQVLELAGKSPFLNGDNDRNWKANFDWIFNPTNFSKILDGCYPEKDEKEEKLIYKPKP